MTVSRPRASVEPKQQKVTLEFPPGPLEVDALVIGGLAVHRCWEWTANGPQQRRGYKISHVATGFCLGYSPFKSKICALIVARKVWHLYSQQLRRISNGSDLERCNGRPWFRRMVRGFRQIVMREVKRATRPKHQRRTA